MTPYGLAESNVRKTWFLITGFLVIIIAFGWLFSYVLDSPAILIVAVIFSAATSFFSYWNSDKLVLSMARAKPIKKEDNPQLYRLVENLCITAGLPLPRIYLINESQPNAFATGRDKDHAAVAVTQGLLDKLDKTELEGVIGHELSHVQNKDILLQTVIVVLVGIIALVSNWFMRINFYRNNRSRDSRDNMGAILLVLGLVAAILAPIAANLIKLAISRKREFLADASSALLTRYPEGLASALEKIASDPNPLSSANGATAHLYISSPFRGGQAASRLAKLFMTHPPTEERVKALRDMKI